MKPRRAFTLIELLVVITVISILMVLMLPVMRTVREVARRTKCSHNLHQIHPAIMLYADEWRGWLPNCSVLNHPPAYPKQLHNLVRLYIGNEDDPPDERIEIFHCPSDGPEDLWVKNFGSSYQVNSDMPGTFGATYNKDAFNGRMLDEFPDPGQQALIRDARGWHRLSRSGGWTLATTMGQQVLYLDSHVRYFGDVDRHAAGIW
ncbi:prepilin-type N-terminal cleavage/methylation domain-containing protein [bacterium]|nr:prepilin-type N-terminal cleavage/methylation domain-containing protein [bacterium]